MKVAHTPIGYPPFSNQTILAQESASHWRKAFFISTIFIFILLMGNYSLIGKIIILPFVAMIRPGENLTIVGTIPSTFDMGAYPDVVTDVLNRWLFNSRQMTVEPVAYDKLYSLAEAYQSDALTKRLASFKTSQRERIATGRAADIKIVAIQPLAGSQGHSWEIDWRETIYTIQGYEIPEESGLFHATVRVVQLPPAPITAAGLYQNPLRIYIDEFLPQQRTQGH